METYIVLEQFTQQGITSIKEIPARVEAARQAVETAGGKWLGWYLTVGRYDAVVIFQAPDSKTATKALLTAGAAGNVRTETLRAFNEEDFNEILAGLT
ncbi:MAG: GYD domain-containing protein [Anaerolineales bacterium]